MSASEFSKSLLKSARIDAPLSGSKTRALAHVEQALKASTSVANAAATTTNAITTTKLIYSVAAAAVIAGGAGMGGGYTLSHLSPHAQKTVADTHTNAPGTPPTAVEGTFTPTPRQPELLAPLAMSAAPAASAEPVPVVDACKSLSAEASNKCSVEGGRSVTFAVRNDCSTLPLDFYLVDQSCKEIFRGIVSPGQSTWWDANEGWVFRMRDHATHKLVREFLPKAIDGAPDRTKAWKGAPTDLPLVSVADDNEPITDDVPSECAHGGGRAAILHVQNERKNSPIAVSTVNFDCKEVDTKLVYPGKKFDMHTSEGHAFRIRDSAGLLLLDIPPTSVDTTTYFTVP